MKARIGLGLGAAALAWSCFASGAFATGFPQPGNNNTYSAQTVALASGANTVAIVPGNLNYFTTGATTLKLGDTVVWFAPTGNTWALNGAPTCSGAALTGTVTVSGNMLTCTLTAGAGTTTFVQVTNAANTFPATLTGPSVAALGANIEVNQNNVASPNPAPVVLITAQNTGAAGGGTTPDPSPIPNLGLSSANTFTLSAAGQPLGIDLTGAGLPAIPPGAGFNTIPATGTATSTGAAPSVVPAGLPQPGVSTAGFLGTLSFNVNTGQFDARNGINLANSPLFLNNSLTGVLTVRLSGDFATITNAYLIPNTNGAPNANMSACTATPPTNAIAGTVAGTKNLISFTGINSAANIASGSNQPVFGVCLVTNGTQVIQPSIEPTAFSNGVPAIAINASVLVAGIPNPIGLTVPNQGFGSINYLGTVFFTQNVFGINNGSPTFFRLVNQSNTAAPVWAVLTKDVPNSVPEVGAGSCTYPAGSSSATLAAPPVPPNAVNPPTTCNVSFVAKLASQPGLPDTVSTNLAAGGSAGFVQPNNATYVTGDDIAILAGTSLNPVAGQGSLHATVYLLSPNSGMRFSALVQSAQFGVLIPTQ